MLVKSSRCSITQQSLDLEQALDLRISTNWHAIGVFVTTQVMRVKALSKVSKSR